MGEKRRQTVMVFHAGALGDFVMTWPLLRAIAASGAELTVVAAESHAALAREALGIAAIGAERVWVNALWREGSAADGAWPRADVVITFVADGDDAAAKRWRENARSMLGAEGVVGVGPPGSTTRARVWERFGVAELGGVAERRNAGGPIVVHVGAGSREKMWPLERWSMLVQSLRARGSEIVVLAGEVERERFGGERRHMFEQMGGKFCDDLLALHGQMTKAAVFVGADTGPTHLAAQLGVPTLALFGPTDPGVWGPVGPRVKVVRADIGKMDGLPMEGLMDALNVLLP